MKKKFEYTRLTKSIVSRGMDPSTIYALQPEDTAIVIKSDKNRDIMQNALESLTSSVRRRNLLMDMPILVERKKIDDKWRLIALDGQYRQAVGAAEGIPIGVKLASEATEADIAVINCARNGWRGQDFIKLYSDAGNENYITLACYMKRYNFTMTVSASLLAGAYGIGTGGGALTTKLRGGTFVASEEVEAAGHGDFIVETRNIVGRVKNERGFVAAVTKLRKAGAFDDKTMLAQLSRYNVEVLLGCSDPDQFVVALQAVFNFRKQRRVFFEPILEAAKHGRDFKALAREQDACPATFTRYNRVAIMLKADAACARKLGRKTTKVSKRDGTTCNVNSKAVAVTDHIHACGNDASSLPKDAVLKAAREVLFPAKKLTT